MYHKRGLWAIKAKKCGVFPRHDPKPAIENPPQKPPKFYPADDVKKLLVNKCKHKPTKPRFNSEKEMKIENHIFFFYGKIDPYVILSLGDQVIRSKKNSETTVIGPPGEPIWNKDTSNYRTLSGHMHLLSSHIRYLVMQWCLIPLIA
ncbi:hypothetical protein FEM48_Zijuj04G0056200 [Ziziphus jujuba var. spinosa]|uniref:Uncharacterized protein n=1 Tax=Ziziphus jujuba var. spinosa TaxID=714518 RepID=A0A978VI40_ZIZJJ|nr:hypothetical protein FEM48_Zijuj04G0056200 [Ziziphus jujuba var. spinosa]